MVKNRTIPFGYCMRNGEIITEQTESKAVVRIFEEYLNGSSFLQIARLMESEKIRYTADSDHWNKHMVKRIIENEKYLGNGKYPQIIDENTFKTTNEKRVQKANISVISEDLQKIRNRTYCSECGHKFFRKTNGKGREYWICGNPDCCKFEYRITDQMIIGSVLTVLNTAIANPNLLESDDEISVYSPTADVIRKQNEISQMMDSAQVDFDRIKSEIFRFAEMKYDCCIYNENPQKTAEIKTFLENHEQLNTLDIDLLKSCVNRILISHFCTIEVEFINGVTIKNITERNEKNANSTECNDNSCEGSDCGKQG